MYLHRGKSCFCCSCQWQFYSWLQCSQGFNLSYKFFLLLYEVWVPPIPSLDSQCIWSCGLKTIRGHQSDAWAVVKAVGKIMPFTLRLQTHPTTTTTTTPPPRYRSSQQLPALQAQQFWAKPSAPGTLPFHQLIPTLGAFSPSCCCFVFVSQNPGVTRHLSKTQTSLRSALWWGSR